MKYISNLTVVFFLLLIGCGSDEIADILPKENPVEEETPTKEEDSGEEEILPTYEIKEVTPLKAKIGDTITLLGTNLNLLENLYFLYEDRVYSSDTIKAYFLTKNENEITLKVPKVHHQNMLIEFPDTTNIKLEIIGMISILNNFQKIRQIQVLNENTAFMMDYKKIYKSTDGFYKWETIYEAQEGTTISSFFFLNEQNCWIGLQGNTAPANGVSIHYSENGGIDFNLKFQVNNTNNGNQINNIKFTSLSKGFFVDNNQKMYVSDNNTFKNIYDYYPDLNLLPFGQIDIWDFNAINDDLVFLAPNGDPYLIKIENQKITYSEFDLWPLPPLFFGNIGYVQVNSDIYKTTDLGDSWTKIKTFKNYYPQIQFLDDQMGFSFVNYSPAEMYLTKDGGSSWKKYFTFPQYHDAHHKGFTETNGLLGSANGELWKYRKE